MNKLRPMLLDDLVGQEKIKQRLSISINAAKRNNTCLPHILLSGPAGLGKTSIANVIANEMQSTCIIANGGNLQKIKDITGYIQKIKRHCVFFIDEVHAVSPEVEEFLYPILEDFRADLGGSEGKSMRVQPFTFIAATTQAGRLSRPLFDRLTYHFNLEPYDLESIKKIIQLNLSKLGLTFDSLVLDYLAVRCRGIPRLVNNYLIWVKDYVSSKGTRHVTVNLASQAMDMIDIDRFGMTNDDRRYLLLLSQSNKPMGIKTIASTLGLDEFTVENTIEPYLLQRKLIEKTSKGRICQLKL